MRQAWRSLACPPPAQCPSGKPRLLPKPVAAWDGKRSRQVGKDVLRVPANEMSDFSAWLGFTANARKMQASPVLDRAEPWHSGDLAFGYRVQFFIGELEIDLELTGLMDVPRSICK